MRALLILDIGNNRLTQGKLVQEKSYDSDGDTDDDEEYEVTKLMGTTLQTVVRT